MIFFLIQKIIIRTQTFHKMSEAIKVVVRVRPMNTKQKERNCESIVQVDEQNNSIKMIKPDDPNNVKSFTYDNVFGEDSQQQLVYSKTAYNLVQNVLLGYNGTIFAYGQTGCGKTHSMVGKVDVQELQGIIPRSFGHILSSIGNTKQKEFLIRCSFIEIYNEQVRDLLSSDVKAKLQIKQSPQKGVFIKDLSQNTAKTHEQLMQYMNIGNKNRSVGETAMNKDSSRSHLLFMLYLESAETSLTNENEKRYVASKLNLVDLAGSERLSKTGAEGDRLKEAQKINLSLSALGNVISALVDGKSHHIPYRDSKLTRLLQDSLGGNTKTVMIANCSPADYNFDETLSTLRYASRAKFIKNKPIINQDPKDALLKEYAQQIKRLRQMISSQNPTQIKEISLKPVQNQEMDEKLRQKEQQLSNEKQQKRKLQEKIKQLQKIHVMSSDVHVNKNIMKSLERASLISKQELINPRVKNKQVAQQDEQIRIQKAQQFVTTQQIKLKYKSLVKKLKEKIKTLQTQLKDINHENYVDKESILQNVRQLNKDNLLLQAIINILLKPNQLQTVKNLSVYNQDKQQWKSKQLVLPKLSDAQSISLIKQMQEGRKIQFNDLHEQKQDQYDPFLMNYAQLPFNNNQNILNLSPAVDKVKENLSGVNGSFVEGNKKFSVNEILRDARKDTKINVSNNASIQNQRKNLRKLQLQPIKKEQA